MVSERPTARRGIHLEPGERLALGFQFHIANSRTEQAIREARAALRREYEDVRRTAPRPRSDRRADGGDAQSSSGWYGQPTEDRGRGRLLWRLSGRHDRPISSSNSKRLRSVTPGPGTRLFVRRRLVPPLARPARGPRDRFFEGGHARVRSREKHRGVDPLGQCNAARGILLATTAAFARQ